MVALFPLDPDFLNDLDDAAFGLRRDHADRIVRIGTGEIALATRLVIKSDPAGCVYLHHWHASDPDELHDHPWDWTGLMLRGGYWETADTGRRWREPGSIVFHQAEERHRVELDFERSGPLVTSLVITGPERREWGFHTADGFVVGRDYRSVAAFRARRGHGV